MKGKPALAIALALVVVVGGAAFLLLSSSDDSYDDVFALLDAVDAGGLECDERPEGAIPFLPGGETVFCQIEGQTVAFVVYDDADAKTGDNSMAITSHTVHGTNWLVETEERDLAIEVQEIIGGELGPP